MITLSFSSDKGARSANRGTREQEIRDIIDTHLAFPGSEKLKLGVTIKNNGDTSVSFTGPQEAIAEAKRLWREKVKPAAAKVNRAAAKLRKSATTRAAQSIGRKAAKKTTTRKAAPKAAMKAAKRAAARPKAKAARKTAKKRKS